jgi:hypothetical protein
VVDREDALRIESSVTAISWIPEAATEGTPKIPFELGIGHYDAPPPDRLEPGDLERLRDEDRFGRPIIWRVGSTSKTDGSSITGTAAEA